ncbi:beta-ketoacyl-[acyl-carrier-protein] synthase family protein [Clostridium felsineum]|uniref:beta-ketoacyl-[acyl-carrier-protein] synthase family protein n=1 Tax=Clostridium felsineum TaxID=36839 RepID=UPI00214D3F20|nr:beta-ketoacyl-[acyl-carrier-protein] synthase family protein [Clostridium felsineum]MCR3759268.1 beta-ketoacyl-[acyl-carrier-protein] synthase family protein [Clostridium felsineum]
MNRVVITGMGAVTPFGLGVDTLWQSLLKNKNGIIKLELDNIKGDIIGIGGCLPEVDYNDYLSEDKELFSYIPQNKSNKSFFMAVYEALKQANLDPRKMASTDNIGMLIADRDSEMMEYVDRYSPLMRDSKTEDVYDKNKYYKLLNLLDNNKKEEFNDRESINHYAARNYKITGPQLSVATACASGNNAIGEAFLKIKSGYIDIAIAGGAYSLDLKSMIGFTRIGALTPNEDPEIACRPFDANRDGFVMTSGCGILILESLESALKRNAKIFAEVIGYGSVTDAYRSTDPDPEARAAIATMKQSLQMAKLMPSQIDYINAHGTSTKMNDYMETIAVKNVFGDYAYKLPISSTKSMIGHSVMAAAAIEAIVCIKSINDGIVHQTRNFRKRDPELDLDYVKEGPRKVAINYALSNSFGFGGQNSSIVLSKFC